MTLTVGDRYTLQNKLGEGGMGVVYSAYDRLNGQTVALKQVRLMPAKFGLQADADTMDLRLALAKEFQLLASLRHPHIISVLDYSFDIEKQPYFTMNLLESPEDINEAAQRHDLRERMQLVIQVLQALAYLHRRGIIHRDLKPGNILIDTGGQVKVLDFGLATEHDMDTEVVGTLQYMAPEVLQGEGASIAADLYAVGIIAYELLAGQHPFHTKNTAQLVMDILNFDADVSKLPTFDSTTITPAAVIKKLLAKTPAKRYSSANAVIQDLCKAVGLPIPDENAEIRESFLQAASFVGRDTELQQLTTAFDEAANGHGSLWLVGGESGVGKSRLVDELRIRAFVRENEWGGTLVLQGQAVESGGSPYYLWREPVRRLLLSTPQLDPLEASILKTVVPDIGAILGYEVEDAPTLSATAQQERLFLTILTLFQNQQRPVLLILEDLHWANENLNPLRTLADRVGEMPLLIIGSYRDDEKPDLPERFPAAHVLKLKRFDEEAVSALTVSILGEVGEQKNVVDLLQRETEGNAFFLVEVIRTLAEEAGSLNDIGRITLPLEVFAGGVQAVIMRRLNKIPENAQLLLKWAALIGRRIDRAILERLMMQLGYQGMRNLDRWLTLCANAAVLEPIGSDWRFAHDKLRATVLAGIEPEIRPQLSHEVAEAVEAAYPNDRGWAAALVELWRTAGDAAKELQYILIAAEQAVQVTAAQEGLELSLRGLELSPTDVQKLDLFRFAGDSHQILGNYEDALFYFQQCLDLSQALGNQQGYVRTLINFGALSLRRGELEKARGYLQEGLQLARPANDQRNMCIALNNLGLIATQQGDFKTAVPLLTEALQLAKVVPHEITVCASLSNLGIVAWGERDYDSALEYFIESAEVAEKIGDRRGMILSFVNLGGIAGEQGHNEQSRDYLQQGLQLARFLGDRRGVVICLINLAEINDQLGDTQLAQAYLQEALQLAQAMGDQLNTAFARFYLGNTQFRAEEYDLAGEAFALSLEGFRATGYATHIAQSNSMLGLVAVKRGDLQKAKTHLHEGLKHAQELDNIAQKSLALTGFVHLYLAEGLMEECAELLGLVEDMPAIDQWATDWLVKPVRQQLSGYEAAVERGKNAELNVVISEILAQDSEVNVG
jgi:eukaryotic-like serine/threonine-protein kinase